MAGDTGNDPAASTPETSPESVVRAYWERVWLGRDLDALNEIVADPIVRHTAEGTQVMARSDLRRRLLGGGPSRRYAPARSASTRSPSRGTRCGSG